MTMSIIYYTFLEGRCTWRSVDHSIVASMGLIAPSIVLTV